MRNTRHWLALIAAWLVACPAEGIAQSVVFADGFEPRQFCDLAAGPTVCPGFNIAAPAFAIQPGEVAIRSFYFRNPSAATLAARRVALIRNAAVMQLQLSATVTSTGPQECRPPGTLDVGGCCAQSVSIGAVPLLIAQRPTDDLLFSVADENGVPLALEIQANQPLCVQITGVNTGVDPSVANASVQVEAQLPSLPHVATAPLLAITTQISIPPMSNGPPVSHSCATRAGPLSFWRLTTRTFRRGVDTRLSRGPTLLLQNLDWETPQAVVFQAPNFVAFNAANPLVTSCTYNNPTVQPIGFGADPQGSETCEAFGYFFPSSSPSVCVNGLIIL